MSFRDIIEEQDELAAHRYEFYLWPKQWLGYTRSDCRDWRWRRLKDGERQNIPNKPGIYTLLVQPGIAKHPRCSYLMYVGKTRSLRERFRQYLGKERTETGRPKIMRLMSKYENHMWFCFAYVPRLRLGTAETALIEAFIPPCNDQLPAKLGRTKRAF